MINIYTEKQQAETWLKRYRGKIPIFVCVLGFTETCLIPGISAAGLTPADRQYTACADAEFLYYGAQTHPRYPLPPLTAGASPVVISRAVVANLHLPLYIFNAGLPIIPSVPCIDLGGYPARCISSGAAMNLSNVKLLFDQGLSWGSRLSAEVNQSLNKSYLIFSECVVGGTTTALSVLTGLGIDAVGKVNSSHPICNHQQKWDLVQAGLSKTNSNLEPLELVAAVGDPMQIVVAAMAIAASRHTGVLLAGGTQMIAVYALMQAIAEFYDISWEPEQVIIGTTRWVAEDPTGATIDLALNLSKLSKTGAKYSPPLLATQLNFTNSRYPQLQSYEQGFVKEGVGAGAACIAASLSQNWTQKQLLTAIELQLESLT